MNKSGLDRSGPDPKSVQRSEILETRLNANPVRTLGSKMVFQLVLGPPSNPVHGLQNEIGNKYYKVLQYVPRKIKKEYPWKN